MQIHDSREVSGSTWLIIGLGGIGTEVARRARAFGVRVIGSRLHPSPNDPTDQTVTPDQLEQVIGLADVVVLAAPATPETENLVDAGFLGRMKSGGLLVNVARGDIDQDDALLKSHDSRHLSAAVLDVFRTEPLRPIIRSNPIRQSVSRRIMPQVEVAGFGDKRSSSRRTSIATPTVARSSTRSRTPSPVRCGPELLAARRAPGGVTPHQSRRWVPRRLPLPSRIMLLCCGFSMCG